MPSKRYRQFAISKMREVDFHKSSTNEKLNVYYQWKWLKNRCTKTQFTQVCRVFFIYFILFLCHVIINIVISDYMYYSLSGGSPPPVGIRYVLFSTNHSQASTFKTVLAAITQKTWKFSWVHFEPIRSYIEVIGRQSYLTYERWRHHRQECLARFDWFN